MNEYNIILSRQWSHGFSRVFSSLSFTFDFICIMYINSESFCQKVPTYVHMPPESKERSLLQIFTFNFLPFI